MVRAAALTRGRIYAQGEVACRSLEQIRCLYFHEIGQTASDIPLGCLSQVYDGTDDSENREFLPAAYGKPRKGKADEPLDDVALVVYGRGDHS